MDGNYYKLLQVGYPQEYKNWFDYESAVDFEATLFFDEEDALNRIIELCEEAGTTTDPSFDELHPIALTASEWRAEVGEDADMPFNWD
ncbi:hypothetical protein [Photobacterium kishitanii]|uniref:Uncharacterized protein n=1 Tax=Photobacterium kishitanii TaxID=318456 RepID=A0A2T3KLW9_9GAMM|nr:hypothetical protein [Photobacterium kishitanii]PSV00702.1 hypothetical protein C9J27_06055 [Photobacterium kishitanii]